MKKICILAAICFVLTFTACTERSETLSDPQSESSVQSGGSPSESSVQSSASQSGSNTQNSVPQSGSSVQSGSPSGSNAQSSAPQSAAFITEQSTSDSPQSITAPLEKPPAGSNTISEDPEEHFIFCYGEYDEDSNTIEMLVLSTDSGDVSLYESGTGNDWTKIADIPDSGYYSYKITKDFKEKKIKAVQEAANGKLESTPFSVVFRDGSYVCEMLDSDNDKLSDLEEKMYGTDPDNPDTDGDGFSDYDEIHLLGTDPLVKNENGDQDGDGLSDKKELELGTDPRDKDTDGDRLSDFDEINKYKTDPLNPDTDGDGLKDGAEISVGLDPKNPATFGVPDAEYKKKQIIKADSDALVRVNKNNPFTLSLEITASGDVEGSLIAGRSGYATVIQSDNQIGEAIELKYNGGKIDEVVLHFQIADEYVQNQLNYYPDYPELHGVNRFNIFKYFEDLNMLLPIETVVDTQTNTITSTVDELGTYCVIDMEKWLKNIEDFVGLQGG